MFISESGGASLIRQMYSVLRAVVQAGITDLTTIREVRPVIYRDVIRRTDLGADPAMDSVIIDDIALCGCAL